MLLSKRNKDNKNNNQTQTKEEGYKQGQDLQKELPLEEHAVFQVEDNRPNPVDLLIEQGKSRVQELLPLRYERMSVSAFTFYRGAALIMASDLSHTPTTGLNVQACGDAHISNFGLFSSPERRTVFDINDFDETSIAPWEWDVKRLATSVEICGRDNGFSKKQRKAAVKACVEAYRKSMQKFAEMGHLEVWYAHFDVDTLYAQLSSEFSKAEKIIKKAKGKNSARAIQKLTEKDKGQLRIISDAPVIVPLRDLISRSKKLSEHFDENTLRKFMQAVMMKYRETLPADKKKLIDAYTPVDMAHKVVGVGSVGTRAWIVVLQGADENDALVLQIKEAEESVLERFCGKSQYRQHGHRVIAGQQSMQTVSDMFLGWCRLPDISGVHKDYYVRQLWDGKGSIDLSLLDPTQLTKLAQACGWTLAHAHARTGNRFAIASYLGEDDTFDKAIAKFATAYADQNEKDYQVFIEAWKNGELC